MSDNILVAILTSSLFAAIITNFINYTINNKKIIADNIIAERKNWRENIRNISLDINMAANDKNFKKAVSKLKVNINAYGFMDKRKYMQDGHIWRLIENFEKESLFDSKLIESYKIGFTNMLSALLKYDWERSKSEIRGSSKIKGVFVTNFICMIFGIGCNIFDFIRKSIEIDNIKLFKLILVTLFVSIFCDCVYYLICKVTQYIFEEWNTENFKMIKIIYWSLSALIVVAIFDNLRGAKYATERLLGEGYNVTINFQIAALIVGGLITLTYIREIYNNRRRYFETIRNITEYIESELGKLK